MMQGLRRFPARSVGYRTGVWFLAALQKETCFKIPHPVV